MLVSEAVRFGRGYVGPLQEVGKKRGVVFNNGQVRCPLEVREMFRYFLDEKTRNIFAKSKQLNFQMF
jgi:hypothetical protein